MTPKEFVAVTKEAMDAFESWYEKEGSGGNQKFCNSPGDSRTHPESHEPWKRQ